MAPRSSLVGVISLTGLILGIAASLHSGSTRGAEDPWGIRSGRTEWTFVGSGSTDRVRAQSVFPPDDRFAVADTSAWPYRLVAHLVAFDEDADPVAECSGMLLSPNSILTAAHCVFDYEEQEFVPGILAVPGETALAEPFGIGLMVDAIVPNGWADTGQRKYDVAIIRVEDAISFSPTGPYAIVAGAPNSYLFGGGTQFVTAGYPGDKPLGSQWVTSAPVELVDFDFIYTSMDAYPGQSGSPIFTYTTPSQPLYIVGVFSFETPLFNGAVRFNPTVIEALHDYCDDLGCSFESVMLDGPGTPTATPTKTSTPTVKPTATYTPTPPTATPAPGQPRPYILRTPQLARDGVH